MGIFDFLKPKPQVELTESPVESESPYNLKVYKKSSLPKRNLSDETEPPSTSQSVNHPLKVPEKETYHERDNIGVRFQRLSQFVSYWDERESL
jgi:hypothetical protein